MNLIDELDKPLAANGPASGKTGPAPTVAGGLPSLPKGGLLDTLPASEFVNVYDEDTDEYQHRGPPVGWSADLKRIMALPRRKLDDQDPRAAVAWTKFLRRVRTDACDCDQRWGARDPDTGVILPGSGCIKDLNAIQGWTLEEAYDVKGILGILGVGHGKTGLDILLPWALFPVKAAKPSEAKVVLLLIPSKLKRRFYTKDYPQWAAHFEVPNLAGFSGASWKGDGRPVLEVLSYPELSSKRNSDIFARIRPDAIIADEAHKLKDMAAARTKRFLRVFTVDAIEKSGKPKPYYCPMSGTITDKSIKEYAHHSEHALGEGSPLPLAEPTLDEWASAIDVADRTAPMGRLKNLCEPGETALQGFSRRLHETKGVLTTSQASVKAGLEIEALEVPPLPTKIVEHLQTIREEEVRPDGEQSDGALTTANWAREMASGFYSYWAFPKEYKRLCKCPNQQCMPECEARVLIDKWFEARKNWNKAVRMKLRHSREFMDSPDLVRSAAIRWFDGYEHKGVTYPPKTRQWSLPAACPKCKRKHLHDVPMCPCGWDGRGKYGPLPVWDSALLDIPEGTPVMRNGVNVGREALATWPIWRELEKQVEPEPRVKWVDPFLINAAVEWGKANKGIIWTEHLDFGRKLAAALGVPFYNGGGKDPELDEKGDRSIVCAIRANNEGSNLQGLFFKNLVVHPPTSNLLWEQLLGRSHRQGQRADCVEVGVFLHTLEFRRAFDMALRRAEYNQATTRLPQKLCLATIDLTNAAESE